MASRIAKARFMLAEHSVWHSLPFGVERVVFDLLILVMEPG
jgi:hypothetical protein